MSADKYRGSGEYFLVFNELVAAAKYRGTVTYQELRSHRRRHQNRRHPSHGNHDFFNVDGLLGAGRVERSISMADGEERLALQS